MRVTVNIAALATGLLIAGLAGSACQPARAASSFLFTTQPTSAQQTDVLVNGQPVLTVAGSDSATIADSLARQLAQAADRGLGPKDFRVVPTGDTLSLVAGPLLLVKVDDRIAKAHNLTKWGVAGPWIKALQALFAQPYLAVGRDQITVPVGEHRTVTVVGSAAGMLEVGGYDPQLIEVTRPADDQGRDFEVFAKAPGRTALLFTNGEVTVVIPVWSAEYAGIVDQPTVAQVTGQSVPEEVMREAARLAVIKAIHPRPGAQWKTDALRVDMAAPPPGARAQAVQTVLIEGPEYLPVKQQVTVSIEASDLAPITSDLLLFSNNPERLPAFGQWYGAALPSGRQTRLLYHHENGADAPGDLVVELANTGNWTTRVQVVQGSPTASRDPMWVGHVAARSFMRRQREDIGYLVDLEPGQAFRPIIQSVAPGQCVSGIAEYRVVSGSDLALRVRLVPTGACPVVGPVDQFPPSPQPPAWAFPEAERQIETSYRVGGRWAFISIGRDPVTGLNPDQHLLGNYGVFYDIRLTADNPGQDDVDLELLLTAPAGVARGIFYINGQEIESPLIRPGEDATLYTTPLPAGRSRTLRIRTMPVSGSFYPVVLVARAVRKAPPPVLQPEPQQPATAEAGG
jgi:hypothetical protein